MGNLRKHYIGSISTELKAARVYDRHAIQTHGLRAKTNFSYTKRQIEDILASKIEEDSHSLEGEKGNDDPHNNFRLIEATTQENETIPFTNNTGEI